MPHFTDEIVRYDPELNYDVAHDQPYVSMDDMPRGEYVRYDDHVESHEFVEHIEQQNFQRWFNENCLSENWSQITRDQYWEVWKAAITSKEIL